MVITTILKIWRTSVLQLLTVSDFSIVNQLETLYLHWTDGNISIILAWETNGEDSKYLYLGKFMSEIIMVVNLK